MSYFWKARISLQSIHWPKMRLVDANNSLGWCLGLPVASEYISLSDWSFYSHCTVLQFSLPALFPP